MCGEQKSSIKWFLSILFFEIESLKNLELNNCPDWPTSKPQNLPLYAPPPPALGLQTTKSGSRACTAVLTDGEISPVQGDSFLKCPKDTWTYQLYHWNGELYKEKVFS